MSRDRGLLQSTNIGDIATVRIPVESDFMEGSVTAITAKGIDVRLYNGKTKFIKWYNVITIKKLIVEGVIPNQDGRPVPTPIPNQEWRHKRDASTYTIVGLTNSAAGPDDTHLPPTVVYKDKKGSVWSSTTKDFMNACVYAYDGRNTTSIISPPKAPVGKLTTYNFLDNVFPQTIELPVCMPVNLPPETKYQYHGFAVYADKPLSIEAIVPPDGFPTYDATISITIDGVTFPCKTITSKWKVSPES